MHSPSVCGDCWFLRRVMRLLVDRYKPVILMERPILKDPLYRCFSWWFKLSKDDTKQVLRLMVQNFEGVVYSNHGLHIPKSYLPGGESSGVGA